MVWRHLRSGKGISHRSWILGATLTGALILGFLSHSSWSRGRETGVQRVQLGGAMAIRDLETGEFRAPTAEEAAALTASFRDRFDTSRKDLAGVQNPDGSWTLDLRGRTFAAVAGKRGSDGAIVSACADTADDVALDGSPAGFPQ